MNRVLIVDDDRISLIWYASICSQKAFLWMPAYDYASGLKAAGAGNHELLVLDVMLPGGSGFDLLRNLRKTSTLPVLLLTGRGEAVDRIVGLEIGADDYLPEPCDPRELVARIRAILRADASLRFRRQRRLDPRGRRGALSGIARREVRRPRTRHHFHRIQRSRTFR